MQPTPCPRAWTRCVPSGATPASTPAPSAHMFERPETHICSARTTAGRTGRRGRRPRGRGPRDRPRSRRRLPRGRRGSAPTGAGSRRRRGAGRSGRSPTPRAGSSPHGAWADRSRSPRRSSPSWSRAPRATLPWSSSLSPCRWRREAILPIGWLAWCQLHHLPSGTELPSGLTFGVCSGVSSCWPVKPCCASSAPRT